MTALADERVHWIPSETRKGTVYRTTRTSCTCKSFEYNGTCKHVENLRHWEAWRMNTAVQPYRDGGALAPDVRMDPSEIIYQVVTKGNVADMTPEVLTAFVVASCKSLGVNPYTQPFDVIPVRGGGKRLYPNAKLAEQLRARYGVSCEVVSRGLDKDTGLYAITVRLSQPGTGRVDESTALMDLGSLRGQDRADAIMKCETKAKRRATFSFIGLGWVNLPAYDEAADHAAPVALTQLDPPAAAESSETDVAIDAEFTDVPDAPAPVSTSDRMLTPMEAFTRLCDECQAIGVDPALIPDIGSNPTAKRINDGIRTLRTVKADRERELQRASGA